MSLNQKTKPIKKISYRNPMNLFASFLNLINFNISRFFTRFSFFSNLLSLLATLQNLFILAVLKTFSHE